MNQHPQDANWAVVETDGTILAENLTKVDALAQASASTTAVAMPFAKPRIK